MIALERGSWRATGGERTCQRRRSQYCVRPLAEKRSSNKIETRDISIADVAWNG